jgi:hypothetical protein
VWLDVATGATLTTVDGGGEDLQLISRTQATMSGAITNMGTLTLQDDNAASTGGMTFSGSVTASGLTTFGRGYAVSLNAGSTIATA